ncbi:hypothetical protein ACFV2X_53950 [Streptomyces sp. NPDC059679]|uniref:hypothetical protein n=1 Tax=Streptomyces sp. NPDC059679 TaxID=3346903 RepID=UPI0036B60F77
MPQPWTATGTSLPTGTPSPTSPASTACWRSCGWWAPAGRYRKGADDVIDLLLRKRIPMLVASQGGPKRYLDRFHDTGTICLHVVAGEEHAAKAAAGVDGLIVVGGEAGGHPPPPWSPRSSCSARWRTPYRACR